MIKLTLPRETVIKGGLFFEKVTEAANRGCKLNWDRDYRLAIQILDTNEFFTNEDAEAIVNAGGEVEGYSYWIKIKKTDFENTKIPNALVDYLNNSEEGIEVVTDTPSPTYKDVFKFTKEVDGDYIEYLNSANSEILPMSLTLKL